MPLLHSASREKKQGGETCNTFSSKTWSRDFVVYGSCLSPLNHRDIFLPCFIFKLKSSCHFSEQTNQPDQLIYSLDKREVECLLYKAKHKQYLIVAQTNQVILVVPSNLFTSQIILLKLAASHYRTFTSCLSQSCMRMRGRQLLTRVHVIPRHVDRSRLYV